MWVILQDDHPCQCGRGPEDCPQYEYTTSYEFEVPEPWQSEPPEAVDEVKQFVERCREIRDGSPNAFYSHVDAFCKAQEGNL